MTFRAVILGLLAAVFIATAGYFNSTVPRLNPFVGNHLPIMVFVPLFGLALLNPLLGRLRFATRELAVIALLALAACTIPGSGLLRFWSRAVVMPVEFSRTEPAWGPPRNLLAFAPDRLFFNNAKFDDALIAEAANGVSHDVRDLAPPTSIHWRAWQAPLVTWMPLVVLFAVASICLALVVHRQWTLRERLPYPVAQMAAAVLGADSAPQAKPLLRRKPFWIAAGIIFFIHLCNGLSVWTDGRFIQIPTNFDFFQIVEKYPNLVNGTWWIGLVHIGLYPSIIAFACLVGKDVSLTLGLNGILFWLVGSALYEMGVPSDQAHIQGGIFAWQMAGSFIAVALILLYVGRRYYSDLLTAAFAFRPSRNVQPYEAWACRILLAALTALVLLLVQLGLPWPFAILAVPLFLLGFLVFGRINAESGLIFIQTYWQPISLLIGLFGVQALGLHAVAIIGVLGTVFSFDLRECMMPFLLNGLRITQLAHVPAAPAGRASAMAFLVALAAAVPFGLWIDHNWGVKSGHGWAFNAVPKYTFDFMAAEYDKLERADQLETSAAYTPLQRLTHMSPNRQCLTALAAGFGAVILLSALRLRFTWWPLHPILLLVWGTYAIQEVGYSFLAGWFIKRLSLKYGLKYESLKTFMIGVVIGDLAGGAFWIVAGTIYYFLTNQQPPRYLIFPA